MEKLIHSFDPQGGILNEKNKQRGIFYSKGKGEDAILTLRLKGGNITDMPLTFELFNSVNSIVKQPNDTKYRDNVEPSYNPFPYNPNYTPLDHSVQFPRPLTPSFIINKLSWIAIRPETPAYPTVGFQNSEAWGRVGYIPLFNDKGELNYTYLPIWHASVLGYDPAINISCGQMPYKRLLDNISNGLVMHVKKMRIESNNPNQFANGLEIYRYSSLGQDKSIFISPSEFKKVEDKQGNVIDIDRQFYIDKLTAIYSRLEAWSDLSQTPDMTITFWIKMFKDNGIRIAGDILPPAKKLLQGKPMTQTELEEYRKNKINLNKKGEHKLNAPKQ